MRNGPQAAPLHALWQNPEEFTQLARDRLGADPLNPTAGDSENANLTKAGLRPQQIADALHDSVSTVAFHQANIYRRSGSCSRRTRLSWHVVAAV